MMYTFLAQLWRFNEEGQLENKLRKWRYSESYASFNPNGTYEGFIKIHDVDKVLTLKSGITKEVVYEDHDSKLSQMWRLGQEKENGWRNIIHNSSGLYLTSRRINKVSLLVAEPKGNEFETKVY